MSIDAHGAQRHGMLVELEVQAAVIHAAWVLRMELGFSAIVVDALKH